MQFLRKSSRLFLWICGLLGMFVLTACQNETLDVEVKEVMNECVYNLSENDRKTVYQDVVEINLNEQEKAVIFTKGGEYFLSGKLVGSILIDV